MPTFRTPTRIALAACLAAVALIAADLSVLRSAAPHAAADDDAEARARFRKEMDSVYDYLPADVTQQVRDSKVAQMDRFWAFVAADKKTYLPLLREALRDEKSNRYFLYDGAGLLVEHSKEAADVQLACDAAARCRLKDVGKGYFYFCHHLLCLGGDAIPAVMQMLEDPSYKVIVAKHALRLQQSDCVRLCALLADEKLWVDRFAARVRTEKDSTARTTLLRCLADAVTPEASAALNAIAADKTLDPAIVQAATSAVTWMIPPEPLSRAATTSREEFAKWLAAADAGGRIPQDDSAASMMRDAPVLVTASDLPAIRSLRRKTARRISDEALEEIRMLTSLMRRAAAQTK